MGNEMTAVQEKTTLFGQEFTVGLTNSAYLIEKVTLPPIKKKNITFRVQEGTIALVGGQKYKGQNIAYQLSSFNFTDGKKNTCDIYLYPDKPFESITVSFFGGQHEITLSAAISKFARAKFAIVGSASIEIGDFKDLAKFFGRTITKEELVDEINKNYRAHLTNEVSSTACKYITRETTEIELQQHLNDIAADVMRNSKKTASLLMNMGLMMSHRGISMHLNPVEGADEQFRLLNEALMKKEMESFDQDKLDREERERAAQRQHEIDRIRAENTTREETDQHKSYSNNGPAPVTVNESTTKRGDGSRSGARTGGKFCTECGAEIKGNGKFCANCGARL